MSHSARLAVSVFVLAAACSNSKPPEGQGAEAPVASAEPSTPAEPSASEPAAVEAAGAEVAGAEAAPSVPEAPSIATLFVREALADCQAEGARKCLMVRGSEGEQWRNFYGTIEGFDYEPAYAYELRVEVTHVANPPPDAPSIHYKLVEVVSKRKTAP
jgi:hypothetical protein